MSDESSRHDPLADVINVLAAPIANGIRSVDQFQRGVGELLRAVENLNRTLENLNETTMRVNRLVGEIEEPVRVMMPQVTRTVRAADEMTSLLEGPVRVAAPQIERIVETLSSPAFSELPDQLGDFMQTIGDVSTRLGPLTQLAENAGGLLGAFKLPGMAGSPKPAPPSAAAGRGEPKDSVTGPPGMHVTVKRVPADSDPSEQGTTEPTAKRTAARKPPAKKSPAKKSPAKKSTAKKSGAKKSSTPRTGAERSGKSADAG